MVCHPWKNSSPREVAREDSKSWHTELSSLLLLQFPASTTSRFEATYRRHCPLLRAAFLRGFFDSEGWVYLMELGVANTDHEKCFNYVSELLESFGLECWDHDSKAKAGRIVMIKGKLYHANKDCYSLLVDRSSLRRFSNTVGFTIRRKQQRLALAIAKLA